jgi:hypothetical protein
MRNNTADVEQVHCLFSEANKNNNEKGIDLEPTSSAKMIFIDVSCKS